MRLHESIGVSVRDFRWFVVRPLRASAHRVSVRDFRWFVVRPLRAALILSQCPRLSLVRGSASSRKRSSESVSATFAGSWFGLFAQALIGVSVRDFRWFVVRPLRASAHLSQYPRLSLARGSASSRKRSSSQCPRLSLVRGSASSRKRSSGVSVRDFRWFVVRPLRASAHRGAAREVHLAGPETPVARSRGSPGAGGGVASSLSASRATPTLMAESATLKAGQW